jgi:hypothetical protein
VRSIPIELRTVDYGNRAFSVYDIRNAVVVSCSRDLYVRFVDAARTLTMQRCKRCEVDPPRIYGTVIVEDRGLGSGKVIAVETERVSFMYNVANAAMTA